MSTTFLVNPFRFAGAAPPTLNGVESFIGISTASTTQNVSLAGQTFTAGDYLLALGAVGGNVTVTACVGATDDTYTQIDETGGGADAGLTSFEGTVVSSLDASIDFTIDPSRRGSFGLATISGTSGNGDNPHKQAESSGTSDSPASPSVTTTVNNCMVTSIIGASGAHNIATLTAALPAGYTFGAAVNALGGDAPSNNSYSTLAFAHKTQAAAGATGAATWTSGLGASVAWRTQTQALKP